MSDTIKSLLTDLDTLANQAGFLLQLSYFRATSRFFSPTTFVRKEWEPAT
ncbi:hypothetical protein [Spirosoma sp. KUDC1026]|nr:hypothetical protein [Spirosoma sp. KUDC1026]QKZ12528.1 hypothetical protein HU175_07750 [Spirosoma sp. KUDC1026]